MNHGKLSSALQERYGISDDEATGTVLWHSLSESGKVEVYDMKFGNVVVRNLLPEDIEAVAVREHKHNKRDINDKKRNK
jgi:hypothetical protein